MQNRATKSTTVPRGKLPEHYYILHKYSTDKTNFNNVYEVENKAIINIHTCAPNGNWHTISTSESFNGDPIPEGECKDGDGHTYHKYSTLQELVQKHFEVFL
jgi:hypothetical protein